MMMAQMGAPGHMTPQGLAMQQAALGAAQYGTPPYYGQGVPGAGSYANGGMLPQPMGGPYGQQQMMVYMEQVSTRACRERSHACVAALFATLTSLLVPGTYAFSALPRRDDRLGDTRAAD